MSNELASSRQCDTLQSLIAACLFARAEGGVALLSSSGQASA